MRNEVRPWVKIPERAPRSISLGPLLELKTSLATAGLEATVY